MTVAALEDELSAEELVEWQVFYKLRHEEHERARRRASTRGEE